MSKLKLTVEKTVRTQIMVKPDDLEHTRNVLRALGFGVKELDNETVLATCEACGKMMTNDEEFVGMDIGGYLCNDCDELARLHVKGGE